MQLRLIFNSVLDGGKWLDLCLGRFGSGLYKQSGRSAKEKFLTPDWIVQPGSLKFITECN